MHRFQLPRLAPGHLSAASILLISVTAYATSYLPGRFPHTTIESLVSNSSLIVRGQTVRLISEGSRDRMEIELLETIRGTPPPNRRIVIDYDIDRIAAYEWREQPPKIELLVFIGANTIKNSQLVYDEIIPLNPHPLEYGYATLDFEIIKSPPRILIATRQAAATLPTPSKNTDLIRPQVLHVFDGKMTVSAPVNQLLLNQAGKWVHSPNSNLRLSAAEALTKLNAPDTESIMQKLLDDPFADSHGYELSLTQDFPIRKVAADWLRARQITFAPPVLVDPEFHTVNSTHCIQLALIPTAVISLTVAASYLSRRYLRWRLHPARILWSLLVIVIITAYAHTYSRAHEFWFGKSEATRVIALLRGRLVVLRLEAPATPFGRFLSYREVSPPGLTHSSYGMKTGLNARWTERQTAKTLSPALPGVMFDEGLAHHPTKSIIGQVSYSRVSIPLWPMLLICLIPLVASTRNAIRNTFRQRRGLCLRCGFDLRASGSVCPECGVATPQGSAEVISTLLPPSPDHL